MQPSRYELHALREIQAWKKPKEKSPLGKAMARIGRPVEQLSTAVFNAPVLGEVLTKSVQGVTGAVNDAAQWSVRHEAIYKEYRDAGHVHVTAKEHVLTLDLEQVDQQLKWLSTKYRTLAASEGAAAGMLGALAIPPDLVALLLLNLRAVGEYATYCGVDASSESERRHALGILNYSSAADAAQKAAILGNFSKVAQQAAAKKTHDVLDQEVLVRAMKQLAEVIGVRLTKQKIAQLVPVAGGVVGGGFNAHFTHKVCTAAYMIYRERFLVQKYGDELLL